MSQFLGIAFDANEIPALVGFGQKLGGTIDILLLTGTGCAPGATRLLIADLTMAIVADGVTASLSQIATPYTHIASVSSMQSKDVLARLAGVMDCAMVTDVIAIENTSTFKRPVVAGSIIATVEVIDPKVVITFRPAGFPSQGGNDAPTESVTVESNSKAVIVATHAKQGGRPDLTQAQVVVSGGRPLKDAETFERVIGGLADRLGGAVGATRAAVDSGIAPNELQVGQTGKVVAPNLYIAAGISGSTQHMAGIKDSKTIVAINKDPDAPIFEFADLGLVGDLYDVIPQIMDKLKS